MVKTSVIYYQGSCCPQRPYACHSLLTGVTWECNGNVIGGFQLETHRNIVAVENKVFWGMHEDGK